MFVGEADPVAKGYIVFSCTVDYCASFEVGSTS